MKLADWLQLPDDKGKPRLRYKFAERIGVSNASITCYCDGSVFPSREVLVKIKRETKGAVCADDFLAPVK